MPESTDYEKVSQAKERLQKALDAKREETKAAGLEIVPWDPEAENELGQWAPTGSLVEVRAADIVAVCEGTSSTEDDALFKGILDGSKSAIAPRGPKGPQASPRLKVVVPFSNVEWLLSQAGV